MYGLQLSKLFTYPNTIIISWDQGGSGNRGSTVWYFSSILYAMGTKLTSPKMIEYSINHDILKFVAFPYNLYMTNYPFKKWRS